MPFRAERYLRTCVQPTTFYRKRKGEELEGGRALARTKQRWQGEMHISLARAAGDLMKGVTSYK